MNKTFKPHESARQLQRQCYEYFRHEINLKNGLVADKTHPNSSASISAVGLALSSYPVAVERGFTSRAQAVRRTLTTLRFFMQSRQADDPLATGFKGFYYHFLDLKTGRRAADCELSTIDSAILFAGMLTAAAYFDSSNSDEREIRRLANELYQRADWPWAQHNRPPVNMGWTPEHGFLTSRWEGYCEAIILYVLGLASPAFPLPKESYQAWTSTYQWKKVYDQEFLYAGPLFIHQLSHIWIDFRGIQDEFMHARKIDYFENSRRATYAQRQYAQHNPRKFAGYSDDCWGISASDGPGPVMRRVGGRSHYFFDYVARGIPSGPDDGTIAPWATMSSVAFAPEIVLPALRHFEDMDLTKQNPYGFKATFNLTFPQKRGFWISPYHFALNQGPMLLMIENCHSGLIWRLMRSCEHIQRGLSRAGFKGGWLQSSRRVSTQGNSSHVRP